MSPLTVLLAVLGAAWGVASDRIATRWPEHDDEEFPAGRKMGWRTVLTGGISAVAFGALPGRFDDPAQLAIFTAWFAALTLLIATDLDQHLLPNEITLPAIPIALVLAVVGADPLVHDAFGIVGAIGIALVLPLGLYLLSIPLGPGAISEGDLKLLVSVGLLSGLVRTITGLVVGTFLGGVAIGALMLAGRLGRKSYIPYGPVLIVGAYWAVLVRFG